VQILSLNMSNRLFPAIYMTPKNESMFRLDSFHAPYFENEWAKPK
jgi:hypothetical protein